MAKFLYKLTAADKVEWLTNNLRYRQFLPASRRILLLSGTTANEALHAELNAWYRQVQQMHRSTLALKLGMQTIGKLLSHQTALHWPTTVQMPHAMVLAAATTKPLWTKRTWKLRVQEQRESGVEPLQRLVQKKRDKARIRKFKRPASTEVRQRKRTPFTLERRAGIKRTGVHRRRPVSASVG